MSAKTPLNVVIYWHMHQPEYRDAHTGNYYLPWTYLHVIKDYVDMAAHLENNPDVKAVVNFTPTLLEQIDDYADQFSGYMKEGAAFRDPMLEALVSPVQPESQEQRLLQIEHCLRANEERLVKRYPQYERLAHLAKHLKEHPDSVAYVHDQYLADIVMWFHLAWLGETVRRNDIRVKRLITKGENYTLHERIELAHVMGELTCGIIGRYRTLAEEDRIELSVTPYAHPIVPLLLDIKSAEEAIPDIVLPNLEHYPEGEQRSRWHIEKGIDVFQQHFGFKPAGCWPSEGSVSEATVRLLGEHGFRWYASGETVLRNSLSNSNNHPTEENECIHRCYEFDNAPHGFFRDDGLSDLIGFTYSDWHADDAVANMIHHLENIAEACQEIKDNIVSIILDGENAWEFYPENGYHFLTGLYKAVAEHPDINLTTYSDYLQTKPDARPLEHIVAGSWVYGTFSTWIGDKDKNHAWDMLGEAKKTFDRIMNDGTLDEQHRSNAEKQMAICEGSDWFWWFGDYNPAESVSDFDHLYRTQLTNLYLILGVEPPEYLTKSFSHGTGAPAMAGTMRRGQEH